jgi:transcriptional regulator with XRE-family HTH domain
MRRRDNPTRAELSRKRLRDLGNRIAARRRAMVNPKVTQEDLAQRSGISRSEISRIETGKGQPTVTMIYDIADALGCHISDLFDDD